MSCFDELKCNTPLPDIALPFLKVGELYQFKEFGCNGSIYEITAEGLLVLVADHSNGTDLHSHENYTGELELCGAGKAYIATFENAKLVSVEELDEYP